MPTGERGGMSDTNEPKAMALYAGFWRRSAAALVDLFLLQALALLALAMQSQLILLAASALYFAAMHSSPWQATLGKRAFGIKVTGLDGERITFMRALARTLAAALSVALLFIGLLMTAFTSRKQALHDMIAATLVVNRATAPEGVARGGGTMPVTGGVLAMAVVLVLIPVCGVVAVNAQKDYMKRANVAGVIPAVDPIKERVAEALARKRPQQAGRTALVSRGVREAEVTAEGQIVVTLVDAIGPNARLRFTPIEGRGALQWKCSAEALSERLVPAQCRP